MTSPSLSTVRWGILGCGAVCEVKAGPALKNVPHSSLDAVMRRNAGLAADFARRHGVPKHYSTVDALLADPDLDAIYVATPDAFHEEGTLAAAHAGKHVLVEKAMATSTAACSRMIDACTAAGVVLAVAYYRRCYPSILRAKALIDEGRLGAVQEVWLNDEFPLSHRLDLLHFFNGDVADFSARVEDLPPGNHSSRGPVLRTRHVGGARGATHLGWQEKLTPEQVTITGERGRLTILDIKKGLIELHIDGALHRETPGPLPATHWGLVENFVRHLRGETPLACDGPEGRKSTVILDLVESDTLPHDGSHFTPNYAQS